MSPEQVKGETAGPESDIFSCGVLLYELLTGTHPFEAPSAASVMYRIVHEDIPPPRLANPMVPPHIEQVIMKECSKNPFERYRSALEMKDHIERGIVTALRDEKTVVVSPSTAEAPAGGETILRQLRQEGVPIGIHAPSVPSPVHEAKKSKTLVAVLSVLLIVILTGGIAASLLLVLGKGMTILITSPGEGESIPGSTVKVSLDVKEPGKVRKIELYLDSEKIETLTRPPFETEIEVPAPGSHEIRAAAYNKNGALITEVVRQFETIGEVARETEPGAIPGIETTQEEQETTGGTSPEEVPVVGKDYFSGVLLIKHSNTTWRYSIDYPRGWSFTENVVSYGHRTKWWSPDRRVYFLVDAAGNPDPVPFATPRNIDKNNRSKNSSYRCYRIEDTTFKGQPACIYEFSLTSTEDDFFPGKTIRKYDFFVNGTEHGYAILFAARPEDYGESLQSFIDRVIQSFEPDI